jgi:thioredoxin-related protein
MNKLLSAVLGSFVLALAACQPNANLQEASAAAHQGVLDLERGLAAAAEERRPVLVEFTGSDWCPPCKAMYAEVISTEEFATYAQRNLVFVYLDFPRQSELDPEQRRRNDEAAQRFAIRGFPTFLLLDQDGQELSRHVGYMPGGPEAFISWIDRHRQPMEQVDAAPAPMASR